MKRKEETHENHLCAGCTCTRVVVGVWSSPLMNLSWADLDHIEAIINSGNYLGKHCQKMWREEKKGNNETREEIKKCV